MYYGRRYLVSNTKHYLYYLLAWPNNINDAQKTTEQEEKRFIEAVAEFVIAEWGLLIDNGILTINDGNSENGANV